jgi:hypothetical protein
MQDLIDSIEFAIQQIHADVQTGALHDGYIVKRTLQNLKMIKISYLLEQRNAAKEQRKGRAKNETRCGNCGDNQHVQNKDCSRYIELTT